MSSELGDLMEIVGDLKDEIFTLTEKLQTTREQVALLTEALDVKAPGVITSLHGEVFEPTQTEIE